MSMRIISPHQHILSVLFFALFSFALSTLHVQENVHVLPGKIHGLPGEILQKNNIQLHIVIPEESRVTVPYSRHRIAANTDPEARAFINDKEVKVYPNGAFVGMVDLPVGNSTCEIKVVTKEGDTRTKMLSFYRTPPPSTTPPELLVIEDIMMKPEQTLELGKGDVLTVQFKGSSGHQASFSIEGVTREMPMQELPLRRTGGVGGLYAGEYTVSGDEHVRNALIQFTLRDERGNHKTMKSTHRVSLIPDAFPRVAEVNVPETFLYSNLHIGRLGGNRIGKLEKGVRVKIIARKGAHYRVRLSDRMNVYLPVSSVELLPESTPLPHSPAGSVSITGNTDFDIVTLSLGERLPWIARKQTDPHVIEVDVYGAESFAGLITQHENTRGIRSVEREQINPETFRLRIHLEDDLHWGYHVGYGIGTSLRIQVRRPPYLVSAERPLENIPIAIDIGHGGTNYGALGSTGTREKDIVLDIGLKVEKKLKIRGARVITTRNEDITLSLPDRSNMIIDSGARILVSIHANSIGNAITPTNIQGTSSYYRYAAFRPLAEMVHRRMLELPLKNFGLIGNFNFVLNTLTELPNVLVETAFISHPEDEMKLMDPAFQEMIAEQIVLGLYDFFQKHGKLPVYPS